MVEPTMPITEAMQYMEENKIRHLPVIGEGKRLLGLVTQQTLVEAQPPAMLRLNLWEINRALSQLMVGDVMVKDVITVKPDATIEQAARLMIEHKIGCLLVLREEIVLGIITKVDLHALTMELLAARRRGVRAVIRMPDVEGELAKLVATIAEHQWGILACGGVPSPKEPGMWDALVKLNTTAADEVEAALSGLEGQQLLDIRVA
jgi:acetoin utilization protein AcuB